MKVPLKSHHAPCIHSFAVAVNSQVKTIVSWGVEMSEGTASGQVPHLFCFGLEFSARALAVWLMAEGCGDLRHLRDEATRTALPLGIRAFLFDRERPLDDAGVFYPRPPTSSALFRPTRGATRSWTSTARPSRP